jgi:translation initiation factor IF-2
VEEPIAADGAPTEPASGSEAVEQVEEPIAAAAATPATTQVDGPARRTVTTVKPDQAQTPGADRKGRQRKRVREVVNLQEQEQFARQITGRGAPRRASPVAPRVPVTNPRRKRRDKLATPAVAKPESEQNRVVKVEGEISVGELAKLLGAKAPVVQGKLMALGIMVSINQTVDVETSRQVATEFGFEVLDTGFKEEAFLEPVAAAAETEAADASAELRPRPPVITVMGHVDHGKTSLLDAIRNTKVKVADGEAGGITQHIGAYEVEAGGHQLTFIDTPGHAAFTAMRARGAAVTDMVVLVIAANDGVMPQTVEAIEHAQAAGCPIVVAINKVDLPDADPEKTKQRLTEHNLVAEDFGGDVICVNVSAKTGDGLPQLLEMLALQSEVLELGADAERRGKGVVLEARLDKGRGPVATVLVQDGTLRVGDVVVVGTETGRIRVMENDAGQRVKEAGPSTPVQVVGLSGVPAAGSAFHAVESDRVAKQITSHREEQVRSKPTAAPAKVSLEEFFARAEGAGPKELTVVLKSDVQGTSEAVRDALEELSTDDVKLRILSSGVGAITENDVMLATASGAIVIGFHVRPDPAARRSASVDGVDVRTYTVIMDLLDEVKAAMAGLLPPTIKEHMLGRAEIKQTFTIPKVGTIAGSLVVEGKIARPARCRLVRDGVQVYEGALGSLRRFKDEAKEVTNGMECGIGIENYNDVKVGDVIEVFEVEEVPATL